MIILTEVFVKVLIYASRAHSTKGFTLAFQIWYHDVHRKVFNITWQHSILLGYQQNLQWSFCINLEAANWDFLHIYLWKNKSGMVPWLSKCFPSSNPENHPHNMTTPGGPNDFCCWGNTRLAKIWCCLSSRRLYFYFFHSDMLYRDLILDEHKNSGKYHW